MRPCRAHTIIARCPGIKKPKGSRLGLGLGAWRFPTFARQTAALSSALGGFTSGFGMGPGGSRPLWSPSNLVHSPQGPAGLRWPLPGHPFTCFPYRGCSVLSAGRVRPAFCFGWEAFGHTSWLLAMPHLWKSVPAFRFCVVNCRQALAVAWLLAKPHTLPCLTFHPSLLGVIWSSLTGN